MSWPTPATPSAASGRPQVTDHRTTPPGVVPRHLQQWVLIGLALVMVSILALSGVPRDSRTVSSPSPTASVRDANQQRIEEYQRRIQEQAQRLAAAQAEAEFAKEQAANAAAATRESGTDIVTSPIDHRLTNDNPPRDAVSRDARGPFADNVAFSRPTPIGIGTRAGTGSPPFKEVTTLPAAAPVLAGPMMPASKTPDEPLSAVPPSARPARITEPSPIPRTTKPPAGHAVAATANDPPRYRLLEGTVIETVLTNRLDGTFTGPVNCLVTTPVYAPGAQPLLIPAGARVLGEAKPVSTFGQSRLVVVFHRVLLPNGSSIDLHAFHGLNQVGDGGLQDQVNRHYAQIFGASMAVGAIAGLAQARSPVGWDATALDVYRQGAAANLAQSSARILDRFLNVLPTVTIREGHRIKVYLANDLDLPAYHDALPPSGGRP